MANLFREEFARKRGKNISNGNMPILRKWSRIRPPISSLTSSKNQLYTNERAGNHIFPYLRGKTN